MGCMHTKLCPVLIFYRLFQQPATSANNITKDTAQPMHCAHNLQILFCIINFHTHDKSTDTMHSDSEFSNYWVINSR